MCKKVVVILLIFVKRCNFASKSHQITRQYEIEIYVDDAIRTDDAADDSTSERTDFRRQLATEGVATTQAATKQGHE